MKIGTIFQFRLLLLIFFGCGGLFSSSVAHEIRPASIQIVQQDSGRYRVTWKQPIVGDMAIRLIPKLSSGALDTEPTHQFSAPGYRVRQWDVDGSAPLDGQTLIIAGLERSVTDVLVQLKSLGGIETNYVLKPAHPEMIISVDPPKGVQLPAYLELGIEHILTGIDHLLFVLGLLLLSGIGRRIVLAITAFTLAHSTTLALAALGYIHVSPPLIETLVALSILFVARELVPNRNGRLTLTQRAPWAIAFAFGFLHGLAFAGALAEIGLPPNSVVVALFLFNAGVEIGQLIFVSAAVAVILTLSYARAVIPITLYENRKFAQAYLVGVPAAYWFIDRLAICYS